MRGSCWNSVRGTLPGVKPNLTMYMEELTAGARWIPSESVDLVFTSPPYKRRDGYSDELMRELGGIVGRVLHPGGRFYMNFGQLKESFSRAYDARRIVEDAGLLSPGQTIAWVKSLVIDGKQQGHYQPITIKSTAMNYCWEPVFSFYKRPELPTDRLSIGVPFADKSNLTRDTRGKHGDLHCAGDVWFIPYKTTGAKKKATAGMGNAYSFPVELPFRAIKLSGISAGSVVFDPFMGSGTTAVAAKQLGMHAWGVEMDKEKLEVIQERWDSA